MMDMIIGEGVIIRVGGEYATIVVTAPTGSTVTMTDPNGVVTTGTESSGTWTFQTGSFGTHTINATKGTDTTSGTVLVDAVTDYSITLSYSVVISTLAVGTSVYTTVNNASKEFIIVHQGNPSSSIYDSSCDGTWLLMKDVYTTSEWGTDDTYSSSTVHSYLNGTFINLINSTVRSVIKQVLIPYWRGSGSSGSKATGSSGLSTKIFLLSNGEVGDSITMSQQSSWPLIGSKLSYFIQATTTEANDKRIAYYNGSKAYWWLRHPNKVNDGDDSSTGYDVDCVGDSGSFTYFNSTSTGKGVRPAFILPNTTLVDTSYNIIG